MALPGLSAHPKFRRLVAAFARLGLTEAHARGTLEMLWEAAYQLGSAYIGDADDLARVVGWAGDPVTLVVTLLDGGAGRSGWIERQGEGYIVHDLEHHAPGYVLERINRIARGRVSSTCESCQRKFTGRRRYTRYCSSACRTAACRARKSHRGDVTPKGAESPAKTGNVTLSNGSPPNTRYRGGANVTDSNTCAHAESPAKTESCNASSRFVTDERTSTVLPPLHTNTIPPVVPPLPEAARPTPPATEPKPKRQRRTAPDAPEPTIPPTLAASPAFVVAWADWLTYRTARRVKTTDQTKAAQLAALARVGPDAAEATIRASIMHGWAGLFPEKVKPVAAPTRGTVENLLPPIIRPEVTP